MWTIPNIKRKMEASFKNEKSHHTKLPPNAHLWDVAFECRNFGCTRACSKSPTAKPDINKENIKKLFSKKTKKIMTVNQPCAKVGLLRVTSTSPAFQKLRESSGRQLDFGRAISVTFSNFGTLIWNCGI